ncbi:GNAT family N-acetyltransferase [Salipaludibacillus agaradhaerens]|uniref:GNAT family N-acetyltransferase n=1 Tax=Salipaludibacillus agaradhaerens TaxID=76935 RepID=A0A9Q4FZX0_SALAG|nr:GNAT family N-acetyltransferase [Salipaludibacillus agaradhaerens]MCR6097876.1 GNAT family N-acetyltransferase [Salipaludibacillus agaradhaerens]MCR6116495.1 GNAT family N-acetyltransferase [Salipaludibacillus agaradhaerens]
MVLSSARLKLSACSPDLIPFMKKSHYHSYPHIQAHLETLARDKEAYGWGPWLIISKETSHIIGDIGFKGKPDDQKTVEVGYGIMPSHRGRGFATEALNMLINWAFKTNKVSEINAQCRHDNQASINVLRRVNMIKLKEEHQMIYWALYRHTH